MTEVRCTIRHLDGSVTTADVTVATPPNTWSPADAKEFLWAVSRLPASVPIYRISLVEVERELSWRVEVVTAGGTVTTPPMRLSSMALVWLGEADLEVPGVQGVH
jgi:hypothetical protein